MSHVFKMWREGGKIQGKITHLPVTGYSLKSVLLENDLLKKIFSFFVLKLRFFYRTRFFLNIPTSMTYFAVFQCLKNSFFFWIPVGRLCGFIQSEPGAALDDPWPTGCVKGSARTPLTIHVSSCHPVLWKLVYMKSLNFLTLLPWRKNLRSAGSYFSTWSGLVAKL